jgi:trehalose utilization protein
MTKPLASIFASLFLAASGAGTRAANPVRVLIWDEQTQPRAVYPNGISGALAEGFKKHPEFTVGTATLTDDGAGVPDDALDRTDVLIWFGHLKHKDVPDDAVDRIEAHVKSRGMGFIGLHSTHVSKPFKRLLNATGTWTSYVDEGKPEHLWIVLPDHPIAKGLKDFTVPHEEIYTEPFSVPEPESVVVEGTWDSGHRNRAVMTWTVGKGRVVYIRSGHEDYPTFFMPQMQTLVANAVSWASGRAKTPQNLKRQDAGPKATATGAYKKGS